MTTITTPHKRSALPKATLGDTLRVISDVILPNLAKGVIIRRPRVVALAARLNLDRRAIRRMQRLRQIYGAGPLLLRTPPGLPRALILAPDHVQRVLAESPEPFAVSSSEKRSAMSHLQPQGLLISHGPVRTDRRRFNEQVLDTSRPIHHLAERFVPIVREEVALLLDGPACRHDLTWQPFVRAWFRMVRRVVLGDTARDDHALTDALARLRSDANWAFLHPKRRKLRRQFFARLNSHLTRAEPGSLAAVMAATPTTRDTAPLQQVPQWLFAFDAAAIATFRALALLAAHPQHLDRAQAEITERAASQELLPYLRACVLESVRLWPTTPLVLRQSVAETVWETGVMPRRTGIIIVAPFFHRDDQHLPFANRFAPELWLEDHPPVRWPLIPFSDGPAVCPGRNIVLLLSSTMLAELIGDWHVRLKPPAQLDAQQPLPATLNNFDLRFTLER